jgi:hypothetical protein
VVHQRSRGHVPDLCADRVLYLSIAEQPGAARQGLSLSSLLAVT